MLTRVQSSFGALFGSTRSSAQAEESTSASTSATSSSSGGDEEVMVECIKMLHARVRALEDHKPSPNLGSPSARVVGGFATCRCTWNSCACLLLRATVETAEETERFVHQWTEDVGFQANCDLDVEWVAQGNVCEAIVWLKSPISLNLAAAHALAGGADDVEIAPLRVPEYLSSQFRLARCRRLVYIAKDNVARADCVPERPQPDPVSRALAQALDSVESKIVKRQ